MSCDTNHDMIAYLLSYVLMCIFQFSINRSLCNFCLYVEGFLKNKMKKQKKKQEIKKKYWGKRQKYKYVSHSCKKHER